MSLMLIITTTSLIWYGQSLALFLTWPLTCTFKGYRFLKKHWGQGYAYEACQACIKYGFNTKQFNKICAYALTNNGASTRLLQKLGFQLIQEFDSEDGHEAWYELNKE